MQEQSYPPHHELMRQFHPITHVYILLEGCVELTALTSAPLGLPCDPDTLAPAADSRHVKGLSFVRSSTFPRVVSAAGSRASGMGSQPEATEHDSAAQVRRTSVWDIAGLPNTGLKVPPRIL
jgi:hypothetical protein